MTLYHSILKSNPADPKLRWMILLSFLIHAAFIASFVGQPPDDSEKVYFSPVYTVNLVDMPAPRTGKGHAAAGGKKVSLWKGSDEITYQVKSPAKRKHTILTVSKKNQAPSASKKTMPGEEKKDSAADAPGGTAGTATGTQAGNGAGPPRAGTANVRFSRYYQALWNKIQNAWVLPHYGNEHHGALEAIIIIKIAPDGKILSMDFEKKSADPNLNKSAIRAIKKADPLPPLPVGFNEKSMEIGIRFMPKNKQ